MVGYLGVERNGPDGQFSASCPPPAHSMCTRIWQLAAKRISGETGSLTHGHTKGCTSWSMRGKNYDVLFLCGLTVSPYKLTNNDKYPNIVEDERSTLQRLGGMHADVLLAPHGCYFDLEGKLARQ